MLLKDILIIIDFFDDMLNKILRISLSNRAITLIISGLLLIWGCLTMLRTDVDIFPDLNAPTVVVMTEAPNGA